MPKLQLQLVTPERTVLSEELVSLSCPTTEGQITLLPGHATLVAQLISGELIAHSTKEETHYIHVAGGFVKINNNEVLILADAAEHSYEIDIQKSEEATKQAKEILERTTLADEEYAFAATVLQKNLNRIKIARKHAHRRTNINNEGVFHP